MKEQQRQYLTALIAQYRHFYANKILAHQPEPDACDQTTLICTIQYTTELGDEPLKGEKMADGRHAALCSR